MNCQCNEDMFWVMKYYAICLQIFRRRIIVLALSVQISCKQCCFCLGKDLLTHRTGSSIHVKFPHSSRWNVEVLCIFQDLQNTGLCQDILASLASNTTHNPQHQKRHHCRHHRHSSAWPAQSCRWSGLPSHFKMHCYLAAIHDGHSELSHQTTALVFSACQQSSDYSCVERRSQRCEVLFRHAW